MEEKIVLYRTAVLAEEKGFKDKVGLGHRPRRNYYTPGGVLNGDCIGVLKGEGELISAPTQSFLKDWLREVHNVHIFIEAQFDWRKDKWVPSYYWSVTTEDKDSEEYKFTHGSIMATSTSFRGHKTYTDALEIGLIEGLNKIKDC